MNRIARLGLLLAGLAALTLLPALFLGTDMLAGLHAGGLADWLRAQGGWAWAVAIGLILGDVLLPIPTTSVLAALGLVYGPLLGGAIGTLGSFLSGLAAYGLARALGRRAALRLMGEEGLAEARRLVARWGTRVVLISRWVPLLPESVALFAGLVPMPAGRFAAALLFGAASVSFAFASLGHYGAGAPLLMLAAAALIPLATGALALRFLARRHARRMARRGRPPERQSERQSER